MDVGIASVATAFGESTIPEILPSHGQHESNRYTCTHHCFFISISLSKTVFNAVWSERSVPVLLSNQTWIDSL